MRVSVVIPTKNAGPSFLQVLQALTAQKYEDGLELIVMDSGSTDDTIAVARRSGALVISIPPGEFNHGLTRNRAIASASGDIIVMLSQDAIPGSEHLVANFVRAFEDPKVAGAYARQVPKQDADELVKRDLNAAPTGRTTSAVQSITNWVTYRSLSPLDHFYFCKFDNVCSAIRKSTWRSIPFRANDFGEDIDWGQQVLEAGWKIAYVPASYVIHSHRPSVSYLYNRHRLTQKKLYEQFGVCTVPSRSALMVGFIHSALADSAYVMEHEHRLLHLLRALAHIPFYSFASLYGQYRGALDARQRGNA